MLKIRSTIVLLCLLATSLMGCATDYKLYSESVEKISIARSNAEAEKYKAMGLIAESGSDAAKVAAVMSMALGNGNSNQATTQLQAPRSAGDTALQWFSLVLPTVVQGYGIHANSMMGIKQADSNARIAESTNSAFVGIAGKIQAPVTVVPQANISTVTTNTDTHAITGSYNPSTTTANTTNSTSTSTSTVNTASGNTTTTPTTTTTTGSYNPVTTPVDSHNTDSHNTTSPIL